MWYVLFTQTGHEQELIEALALVVSPATYKKLFTVNREAVWRRDGKIIVHTENMFPGYVLAETDTPGDLYMQMKKSPVGARILERAGESFQAVRQDEEEFIRNLLNDDKDNIIRLAPVITDHQGHIIRYGGILRNYGKDVVKQRLRLRYVAISREVLGRERDIHIGIRLPGDMGESAEEFYNLFYDDRQISLNDGKFPDEIKEGTHVIIMSGALAGSQGIIKEIDINKKNIGIEVEMFGRPIVVYVGDDVRIDTVEG